MRTTRQQDHAREQMRDLLGERVMTVMLRMPHRILPTRSRTGALASVAALALGVSLTMGFFSASAAAAVLGSNDNVGICHHDNGVKVYNAISPNVDSIVRVNGHDSHSDDIIPSFDYDLGKGAGVQHYPGKNLGLLSTLTNGCVPPPGGPANPTHVGPGSLGTSSSVCAGNPSAPTAPGFTVPTTPGITYSPAVGGTAAPGSTVTVTATANAGYVIDVNGVLSPSVVLSVVIPALATGCSTNVVILPTITPTVTPTTPTPDNLGISKTGTGTAQPGDELVWTLVVTNVAGTPATAFTVTDELPAGLSLSLAEGPGYACNAALQVITCTYAGSLAVGQSAGITVRALLDSGFQGTSVSNTAVVDPGRADSDSTDNSSTAVTTVTQPSPAPGGDFTGGGTGAAVNPPPAAGDGDGAALPFTGVNTAGLVETSVLLVLFGALFVHVSRQPEQSE
jgi:uncharacterized repeat protein (TIGR01451 family)